MPLHKNQLIPLTIESLSSDGNGVGHHEGMAVFVPAAAVGDSLSVRIVKPAKRYAYGRIEQLITSGPGRKEVDCPIAKVCGGCDFQHITYEAELEAKRGFVTDALQRIGKLAVCVPAVLPSPEITRYRNKAQYPVASGDNGELIYGFYASRSHRIVPCNDCLLQPLLLNQIAKDTAALLSSYGVPAYDSGFLRHIYLRQGRHSGQVMLCLVTTGGPFPQAEAFTAAITAAYPQIETILLNSNPANTNVILGPENHVLYGSGTIQDTLCGVPLHLGPHSFSQVNTLGAECLFGLAADFASLRGNEVLLDLYCGAGVIGLSMAKNAKQLIGVEIVAEAIQNARRSAVEMGLANTRFYCEDAGAASARLLREGLRPDIIVLDPPRKGCDEATRQALLEMAPSRIVMISCNPASLARDLAALSAAYSIEKLQPVDMFPRTKHVETVVLMTKKSL